MVEFDDDVFHLVAPFEDSSLLVLNAKNRILGFSVVDPDPHVFGPPGYPEPDPSVRGTVCTRIRNHLLLSKNSKKNLDFYCFVTFFDFLSLKNYVNGQKVICRKIIKIKFFFVGVLMVNDENSKIRIRIRICSGSISQRLHTESGSTPKSHGSAWISVVDPEPENSYGI
jgi:hypothetical protein